MNEEVDKEIKFDLGKWIFRVSVTVVSMLIVGSITVASSAIFRQGVLEQRVKDKEESVTESLKRIEDTSIKTHDLLIQHMLEKKNGKIR